MWNCQAAFFVTPLGSSERLRLSAHLGYLFGEVPPRARFAAAREAGFRVIEIADPYDFSALEFGSLCERHRLNVAQIALPNGESGGAKKGLAALPGRQAQFEEALLRSLSYAKAMNCPLIHPMSGSGAPFEPPPEWDVYLLNLSSACTLAAREGISVIIEPISEYGARNYFMNSFRLACKAIDEVKAPNLLLTLDTYHALAMGVYLPEFVIKNSAKIGHVQVADWPSRNEPGLGQLDFDAFFAALCASGYKGYVGLEYVPLRAGKGQFDWTKRFRALEHLSVASIGCDHSK